MFEGSLLSGWLKERLRLSSMMLAGRVSSVLLNLRPRVRYLICEDALRSNDLS